jgi:hypothetical protein
MSPNLSEQKSQSSDFVSEKKLKIRQLRITDSVQVFFTIKLLV